MVSQGKAWQNKEKWEDEEIRKREKDLKTRIAAFRITHSMDQKYGIEKGIPDQKSLAVDR